MVSRSYRHQIALGDFAGRSCLQAYVMLWSVLRCCPPILTYYDAKKDLILQSDASERALGATLLQDERPVAYASRALTEVE